MATTVNNVYVTLYGYADNDPPGSDTTSLGGHAGGTGSFNDPITAAANSSGLSGQFSYGTKFYVPELQKYFVIGDYMANTSGGDSHVDLWVGGNASTPASQSNSAENALTDHYQIILDPPSNEPVNTTPLLTAANNLDAVLNHDSSTVTDTVTDTGTGTGTSSNTGTNTGTSTTANADNGTGTGTGGSGHHHRHHYHHADTSTDTGTGTGASASTNASTNADTSSGSGSWSGGGHHYDDASTMADHWGFHHWHHG
jgi:hypothetical protein